MNNKDFKQINFYTHTKLLKKIFTEKPFSIFSKKTIQLFTSVSENIFKFKNLNKFPDLATFAFFCRTKNLIRLKNEYAKDLKSRSGRGLALHFTPSNVPLNFAYSLFFSLITGNVTLIRMGENKYEQSIIFLKIFNKVLNDRKFFFF